MDKLKTCAFSGNKPESLPWGYNEDDEECLALKKQLKNEIINAINDGYDTFVGGMARGCDFYFSELVLELKKLYPDIKLICVIPYEIQRNRWNDNDQARYLNILYKCNAKEVIYPKYTPTGIIDRNNYMINNASRLIAVYRGDWQKAGAKNTILYAKECGVNTIIINI